MTTQKALVIPHHLGPYTLVSHHPVTKPGKDEILVRLKSVALNPVDWKIQKLGIIYTQFPAVSGFDMAGEVVEVGQEDVVVGKFAKGDRVLFGSEMTTKEYGAFQEFALADVQTAAKIPSNISFDEAATLPAALCTAYVGMYGSIPWGLGLESFLTKPRAYAGQAIFIAGGSSSVGQGVIQVARLSGFSYIVTNSSVKHTAFLKELGATHIIDRALSPYSPQLGSALAEIPGIPLINYAYDAIGEIETSFSTALRAVGPKGLVVTVNFNPDTTEVLSKKENKEKTVCNFTAQKGVGNNNVLWKELYGSVEGLLERGDVKPARFELLSGGPNAIQEGLMRLEEGKVSGLKLVVHPEETG